MCQQVNCSLPKFKKSIDTRQVDYYHFLAAVTRQEVYRKHDKKNAAEVAGLVK
jgi:hypothetical protein